MTFAPARTPSTIDFRFTNIQALEGNPLTADKLADVSVEQFSYFAAQLVASYEFRPEYERLGGMVHDLIRDRDVAELHRLIAQLEPVSGGQRGPRDLFLPN